jgi:general secretion pathway protein N
MSAKRFVSRAAWLALCAALIAALALAFAPARFLTDAIAARSGGRLVFSEVSGVWWRGQARVAFASEKVQPVMLPGAMDWRVSSISVLAQSAALEIKAPALSEKPLGLTLASLRGGLRAETQAWEARLPMAALQGFGAPWNTLGLEGTLNWRAGPMQLEWSNAKSGLLAGAQGRLGIPDVSSLVSPLKPLGSYAIEWTSSDTEVGFAISTERGPLLIDARGAWVGNQLRLSGSARADKASLPALANLLNIIGKKQDTNPAESGQVLIQFGMRRVDASHV